MDKLRRARLHRIFMARSLIDAHCHLHDERLWSPISPTNHRKFKGVLARAHNAQLTHVVSCATHEQDWRVLEQLMEQQTEDTSLKIVPCFGVHPWWAQELPTPTPDGLKTLRELMTKYPTASIGEIGLCKSARGRKVPVEVQVAAFRVQLELAAELERTCVLHCVGYYGKMLEILLDVGRVGGRLPPVLVMHSYSGPPEMMRSFLALRGTKVFFSLNAKQLTDPLMNKAAACCKGLPLDALLLETDAPDQAPSGEYAEKVFNHEDEVPLLLQTDSAGAGVNEPAMIKLALLGAAEIRGVAIDELATAVYQNGKTAFGLEEQN